MEREQIINMIRAERERHEALSYGGDTAAWDANRARNDWVAYICSYAGRAANTRSNDANNFDFEDNLIKVGALVLAALESHL